jgi:hypothetical protein
MILPPLVFPAIPITTLLLMAIVIKLNTGDIPYNDAAYN